MKRFGKRSIMTIGGVVVFAVGAGAGAAFAFWTSSGDGDGDADTGTNASIVVNQTSTVTGMAPGVAPKALSGDFDNPNASLVYVAAVTATVTGTNMPGCDATDYTIAGTATVGAQIPAGLGVGSWSGLTIQFNNKPPGVNQNACKNAVVAIAYTSS